MKANLYVFAYSEKCGAVDLTFHNLEAEGEAVRHVLTMSRAQAAALALAIVNALETSKRTGLVEHALAFEAHVKDDAAGLRTTDTYAITQS